MLLGNSILSDSSTTETVRSKIPLPPASAPLPCCRPENAPRDQCRPASQSGGGGYREHLERRIKSWPLWALAEEIAKLEDWRKLSLQMRKLGPSEGVGAHTRSHRTGVGAEPRPALSVMLVPRGGEKGSFGGMLLRTT